MAHELPVFEIFSAVHAFVAFLGSLKSEVEDPPDQYEGNRSGNGTLDILIHNKSFQENVSSTGLKNKLNSGEAQKIRLFALG